tara:strand:- start:66389 stop:67000 length:612 start_codon:yes stop_codon:yes gene_type:complete
MKCQYCEKPATFHITELTDAAGPQVMHLCEEHARGFLQKESHNPAGSIAGALAKQLNLGQTKQELAELDQKECPVCGISFFEFRNTGRLGCPYDYTHFESDLLPLLKNVHDATHHEGKHPRRAAASADSQAQMIQLRREMEEAVDREDYERASEIRDELKRFETVGVEDVPDEKESDESEASPRGSSKPVQQSEDKDDGESAE